MTGRAEAMKLPRGTCPVCFAEVAIRRRGLVREHRVYLPQREQDTSTPLGRTRVCEGSGLPSLESAGRQPAVGEAVVIGGVKYRIRSIGPQSGIAHCRQSFGGREHDVWIHELAWDKVAGVWREQRSASLDAAYVAAHPGLASGD